MTIYQLNAYSKIFLESSIVACINFGVMPLKEGKEVKASKTPKMFVPITPPFNLFADFYHLFSQRAR